MYWRLQGIKLAVFQDDGWANESDYHECLRILDAIRKDLSSASFIANEDKSICEPRQSIAWLGLSWNSETGTIYVIDRALSLIFF